MVSRMSDTNEPISSRPYQARSATNAATTMAHSQPRPPPRRFRRDLLYMEPSPSCAALRGWRDPLPRRFRGDLPYMEPSSACATLRDWRDRRPGPRICRAPVARLRSHLTHVQAAGWSTYQLVRPAKGLGSLTPII